MNEIIVNLLDSVKTTYGTDKELLNKNYYISKNGCALGDYLSASLAQFVERGKKQIFTDSPENSLFSEVTHEKTVIADEIESIPKNACAVFVLNCLDQRYQDLKQQEMVAEHLRKCCERFSVKGLVVACLIVPQPEGCPDGITALAEREYDFYLQQKAQLTWQEAFYLRLEKIVRDACISDESRLVILRYTNILGPQCAEMMQSMDLNALFQQAKKEKEILLCPDDAEVLFSYISVVDAVYAILLTIANPRQFLGHILNVSIEKTTKLDVKWALYKAFPNDMVLQGCKIETPTRIFCGLNSTYFQAMLPESTKNEIPLDEMLYQMGCFEFNRPYDVVRKLDVYEGRLTLIRQTEKRMLKVIDSICRENGIQYFLAGGTALGAVRHQDMIPWDDDIDIGMLREEYEKFRKIVPNMLPEDMTYEASNGFTHSHYHFDKIRLKETYFSTKYSSNFRIPDGVFIDILVYDKTSNVRLMQKLHIRLTSMWSRVINVKWVNKPRKNIHYKASLIALPVMRCISWNWFHRVFERIVRLYENKKDARYAIDSVGLNIKKGALHLDWMTNVEYVPFGDMYAPVPKEYDKYLKHFYGEDYMNLLPIDKRVSGHRVARLDMGEKLFGDSSAEAHFRKLDLRGELHEKAEEEQ